MTDYQNDQRDDKDIFEILLEDKEGIDLLFSQVDSFKSPEYQTEIVNEIWVAVNEHLELLDKVLLSELIKITHQKSIILEIAQSEIGIKNLILELQIMELSNEYNDIWLAKFSFLQKMIDFNFKMEQEFLFDIIQNELSAEKIVNLTDQIKSLREPWILLEDEIDQIDEEEEVIETITPTEATRDKKEK